MFWHSLPAENLKGLREHGGGMFRNISLEEEMAELTAAAIDIESGWHGDHLRLFFPSIVRKEGRFPIKVGLTSTGDASPVMQQCKTTCCFRYPSHFSAYGKCSVAAMEDAIHLDTQGRGAKRQSPGTEWFGYDARRVTVNTAPASICTGNALPGVERNKNRSLSRAGFGALPSTSKTASPRFPPLAFRPIS